MNIIFQNNIILCIILSAVIKSSDFGCSKTSYIPVKTYVIDLDKPPIERFYQTSIDFKDAIISYIKINK